MISVLTRTSGRPKFFEICYNSVKKQTFKDWQMIVSVDDKETYNYVKNYPVDIVRVKKGQGIFWNGYFTDLLKRAKGWIVYLDDDVKIIDTNCFEKISQYFGTAKNVIIWKYRFSNGRVIPEREFWEKQPTRKHIDTGCFCHHISQRVHWVALRAGDWRVITQLWNNKLRFKWINQVMFQAGNNGTLGNRQDYE